LTAVPTTCVQVWAAVGIKMVFDVSKRELRELLTSAVQRLRFTQTFPAATEAVMADILAAAAAHAAGVPHTAGV
jgi:hypothetical protein